MGKEKSSILKCQQCLGDLDQIDDLLTCNKCGKRFPIKENLIFMGFDQKNKKEISEIIRTESDHQTNIDEMEKHYKFAVPSFKLGLILANILKHDIDKCNPIALDIGSGGAPMSKILSDIGFETYKCELDPNSLYSGLIYENDNSSKGKFIVCDARILPFSNESVDLVFCKELVHHIEDYRSLFREINRVLRKGGIFLFVEPSLTLLQQILSQKDTHFGHHYQTISSYFHSFNEMKFKPYRYYLYDYGSSRGKLSKTINRFACDDLEKNRIRLNRCYSLKLIVQRIIGPQNVVFLRKLDNIKDKREEHNIEIVDPNILSLSRSYLEDPRVKKLKDIFLNLNDQVMQ